MTPKSDEKVKKVSTICRTYQKKLYLCTPFEKATFS